MRKIIRNAIQCNNCGEIIESKHRHDYVQCKCGACAVDGGHDYLRRSYTRDRQRKFKCGYLYMRYLKLLI